MKHPYLNLALFILVSCLIIFASAETEIVTSCLRDTSFLTVQPQGSGPEVLSDKESNQNSDGTIHTNGIHRGNLEIHIGFNKVKPDESWFLEQYETGIFVTASKDSVTSEWVEKLSF